MVLADYDLDRARRVQAQVGDTASHPAERIDASDASEVEALARAYGVDLVMNAVDPALPDARLPGRARRGRRLHGHGRQPVRAASHRPVPPARASSSATGSSSWPPSGSAAAASRWWAWAWTRACRRSSRRTPRSTCSTRSTRSTSATAATCASRTTASPPCSPSGPPSRSASTRPSCGSRSTGFSHHGAVRGAGAVHLPRGHRPGGVRPRRARGGHPRAPLAVAHQGHLQVRPRRRVHRRAQDAPQHRPRPQRPDPGQGRGGARHATWWRRSCPTRRPWATTCGVGRSWAPRSPGSRTAGRARSTCTRCATPRRRCASIGLQPVAWQTGFNPVVAMELLADGVWSGRRRAGHGGVRSRPVPRHPRPRRHPPRHDGDRAGPRHGLTPGAHPRPSPVSSRRPR